MLKGDRLIKALVQTFGGTVMLPGTNRLGRLLGRTPVKLRALPGALWVFAPKHPVA